MKEEDVVMSFSFPDRSAAESFHRAAGRLASSFKSGTKVRVTARMDAAEDLKRLAASFGSGRFPIGN